MCAVTADPDLATDILRDMHEPDAHQTNAVRDDIGPEQMAVGDEPLRRTGVEAAGDRILPNADQSKGVHFNPGRFQ